MLINLNFCVGFKMTSNLEEGHTEGSMSKPSLDDTSFPRNILFTTTIKQMLSSRIPIKEN